MVPYLDEVVAVTVMRVLLFVLHMRMLRKCEGARVTTILVWGMGMVVVSAGQVASFHPHYLTFTPQTYHHPVHRFRSWPMQTKSQSHPHTQVRVQPRNTYNHTYTKFLPGQNKTTSY